MDEIIKRMVEVRNLIVQKELANNKELADLNKELSDLHAKMKEQMQNPNEHTNFMIDSQIKVHNSLHDNHNNMMYLILSQLTQLPPTEGNQG